MKQRQDFCLRGRLKINEKVPATDQVHPRERRIGKHVLLREYAHIANGLAHTVASVLFNEESAQPLRRNIGCDVLIIEPAACLCDTSIIDVRGKDLHRYVFRLLSRELKESHRD